MIPELIDQARTLRAEMDGVREIAGGMPYRASKIGMCLRENFLIAKGAVPLREFDARTLGVFEAGHRAAGRLADDLRFLGLLLAEEQELVVPEWYLGGHVDLIIGGPAIPVTGIEVKSVHSKSFWWAAKMRSSVAQEHMLIQAATYALMADAMHLTFDGRPIEQWRVLCESKDDLVLDETPVTLPHKSEALRRIEVLGLAWETGEPPACTCHLDWNGKYAKYCAFSQGEVGPCCEAVVLEEVG